VGVLSIVPERVVSYSLWKSEHYPWMVKTEKIKVETASNCDVVDITEGTLLQPVLQTIQSLKISLFLPIS